MDLTTRPFDTNDIGACLELLRGSRAYPPATLAQLRRFWTILLREEALISTVIEAHRNGQPPRIVAFGASVFVTDEWMEEARAARQPHLTARTVRQELNGRSPIVRPSTSAGGQPDARGLNLLMLHYGEARDLGPHERPPVRYLMVRSAIESHRGYYIRQVVQEFWDELDHEFVVHGWGRVWSDYAAYYQQCGTPPPPGERPYLIGITREDIADDPGELFAPLFVYAPPLLGFTRAEQQVLRQALLGHTDVELARILRLAVPSVKSRWRCIYNRVAALMPDLLPEAERNAGEDARGLEKRRRLLDYLRRHPEELRLGLRPLDDRRDALADADAHRREPVARAAPVESVDERGQDA